MAIKILHLVLLAVYLYHNYKKDARLFTKAKVLHAIVLTYLFYYYSTAFAYLGSLFRRADALMSKYNVAVGLMPAEMNLLIWVLQVVSSCLMLLFAWGMVNRKDTARRRLLIILPFVTLVETFSFYRGFLSEGDVDFPHSLILLLGLLLAGSINGFLFLLYRSQLMLGFFASTAKAEQKEPAPIPVQS